MTVGKAQKMLKKAGFEELNWVGSHIKYGRDKDRITIVMHKSKKETLHPKTEKNLLELCK